MRFCSIMVAIGGFVVATRLMVACVGTDPATTTPSKDDAGPVPFDDASSPPAPDGGCTPNEGVACIETGDAGAVQRCNAEGAKIETVACDRGCTATPTPHCLRITPTGIAPADDFDTPGVLPTSIGSAALDSATGKIEGVRAASATPDTRTVDNGIGFHTVTANGNTVGVFIFDSLTINGDLTLVGPHSVVLLAKGEVKVNTINASADCFGTKLPGPGGFAGGTASSPNGGGPGGGKAGSGIQGTTLPGAGGAAHGHNGGDGCTEGVANGGMGGVAYGDAPINVLRGGSGGAAQAVSGGWVNGGAGGGAVQIVSLQSIAINTSITAVGCTGGGGGAGGAILLEAPSISIPAETPETGFLVTGAGGGGGGLSGGSAGATDYHQVFSGRGAYCGGSRCGGQGGFGSQMNGKPGTRDAQTCGSGGGAAGRIRINTESGSATLGASAVFVPAIGSKNLAGEDGFSQGKLLIK